MYSQIIKLAKANEYYGISPRVEIAKGHHEIPETLRDFFKQLKRMANGKRYKL
jgi:hypothetical protein